MILQLMSLLPYIRNVLKVEVQRNRSKFISGNDSFSDGSQYA